jgi:hypothetical protein
MKIQEQIQAGQQPRHPQGQHRVGAPGDGAIDRRARRFAWAKDDQEQAAQGRPPRGVLQLRVLPSEQETQEHHHG